ncbi:MAG TPA: peptidoglycan-binding domain-containing protein [Terriglobales bacterium]|nr:peptidoglycan-binding domain-containing protein [Terriglobales bacterium]
MDRTLSRGMEGQDVAELQAALNYHLRPPHPPHTPEGPERPPLKVDGIFGPLTEARLIEFQQLNDLDDDGVVGRETRPVLFNARKITVKVPINKANDTSGVSSFQRTNATPFVVGLPGNQTQVSPNKPLIAPVKLQNRQVQIGGSLTLEPIVGPGAQAKTVFLSVQWTWVEQKDGRHLELALGGQFALGLTPDTKELAPSAQSFAQVTIADLVAFDKANLHLFSPSAQVSYQSNFVQSILKSNSVGVSAQNQVTWDFVKIGQHDVLSLFCQQQLAWTYDLAARKGTVAPSFLAGAIWQTNFF